MEQDDGTNSIKIISLQQQGPLSDQLDALDRKILGLLSKDSRQSARAIARDAGISPNLVLQRLKRLEENRVILGYRVEVNPQITGYEVMAMVGIEIAGPAAPEEVMDYLMSIRQVDLVHATVGNFDLLVTMRAKDIHDLHRVVQNQIRRAPGFLRCQTMISLAQKRKVGGQFAYVWVDEAE